MKALDKVKTAMPVVDEKMIKYIIGGILLLVFLAWYFLVVQPQLTALQKLSPEITELKQQIQQAKDDVQKMNLYQGQLNQLRAKAGGVESSVQSKEDVPKVLEKISQYASKYRIRVDQIVPLFEAQEVVLKNKEGKYYSLPILVEGKSSYHDFGKFINALETDQASLTIKKFSIMANQQDALKHAIKVTVSAIILEAAGEEEKK
jgi:Tfp pilus assembly protein PilO